MVRAGSGPDRQPLDESTASELLSFSADPSRGLEPLLAKISELAAEAANSDLGAAVFLDDRPLDRAHCHVLDIRSGLAVSDPERAEAWRRAIKAPSRSESLPTPCDLEGSEGLRLFEASRSAIRIYLLGDDRDASMIQVESSKADAFGDDHAAAINGVARVAELVLRRFLLRSHANHKGLRLHIVGGSPALLELEEQLRIIGRGAKSSVLITGERGVGKELAAFAIHHFSPRRLGPFVAINSAALTETLFSDELFGHERGAYTGANEQRRGALLAADGGT
ncbi:MAG: sigma 54-interacting transcriptional regulator, partial [Acidobacteriota bacterium]